MSRDDVRIQFGHDLVKAYNSLPTSEQTLTLEETGLLELATRYYMNEFNFSYPTAFDAGSGFTGWPDLCALEALTLKIVGSTETDSTGRREESAG